MKQRTKIAGLVVITVMAVVLMCLSLTFGVIQYFAKVDAQQALETKQGLDSREEALKLVNNERTRAGIAPLTVDPRVAASAQLKADDMAKYGYLQHDIPRLGKMLTPEMEALLYAACSDSSENFRYGEDEYGTPSAAINAWMNSKDHRNAILNPAYTTTGLGVAVNKRGYVIYVQHFCIAK